jgi:hypothetical protein
MEKFLWLVGRQVVPLKLFSNLQKFYCLNKIQREQLCN